MGDTIILVVDDSPDNLTLLVDALRSLYKIKIATGGVKALAIAATAPQPDLILLDIMMPEMDGFEVCRRLKADEGTKGIPVIFLSGNTEEVDREKGMSLGARGYLTKPIDPEALIAKVQAVLASQAGVSS
ncbi:MAG: response regulator [Spirochaetota bacterium]